MIISRGPTLHLCRVLRCRTIPGNRPRFCEQADGGRPGLSIHLASRNVIRRGVGGVLPQDRSMERPRKGGLDGACMRSFNSPVQLVEISWGRPVKPSLKLGICGLYVIMEGVPGSASQTVIRQRAANRHSVVICREPKPELHLIEQPHIRLNPLAYRWSRSSCGGRLRIQTSAPDPSQCHPRRSGQQVRR
jgi:hypothetical protein